MYKYIYYDLTLESIIKWYQCGVILDAESVNMGLIIDNIDVFLLEQLHVIFQLYHDEMARTNYI